MKQYEYNKKNRPHIISLLRSTHALKLHYGMNVKYVCPTSQDFQVSPSHGSPLSWPLVREHCAPWRLLLWRWEFAGSHLCSAVWEWEREGGEKEEWGLYILWFLCISWVLDHVTEREILLPRKRNTVCGSHWFTANIHNEACALTEWPCCSINAQNFFHKCYNNVEALFFFLINTVCNMKFSVSWMLNDNSLTPVRDYSLST